MHPVRRTPVARLLATALLSLAGLGAQAQSLTATQIIQNFNVVTLGDFVMAGGPDHVEGLTFVGGNLTGPAGQWEYGEPNQHNAAGYAGFAGLTVLGDASKVRVKGGATVLGNFSNSEVQGGTAVAGTFTNVNVNGGGVAHGLSSAVGQQAASTAQATDFSAVLHGASDAYKALGATGSTVTNNGFGKLTFTAVAGNDGVAVFDLAGLSAALTSATEFDFVLGAGVNSVVLNSDLTTGSLGANFLGGSAVNLGSKLLWNFYDASQITFNAQFGGSILAPDAAISNPGGASNLEGGVFVKSLTQLSEIHQNGYVGGVPAIPAVPEPESWLMLAAGLLAVGGHRRLRQRKAA
ncbi:MAG: choice-of-anchor A family protein [Roseateles sp.]|uniref:choice-of-anchor A family protein n=1 Tax=Roseateles sp. TaxID=1971397 RepID=UPI0039EB84EA